MKVIGEGSVQYFEGNAECPHTPARDAPKLQPQDSRIEFISKISHACDDFEAPESIGT